MVICKDCDKEFKETSKQNKICDFCKKKSIMVGSAKSKVTLRKRQMFKKNI